MRLVRQVEQRLFLGDDGDAKIIFDQPPGKVRAV